MIMMLKVKVKKVKKNINQVRVKKGKVKMKHWADKTVNPQMSANNMLT